MVGASNTVTSTIYDYNACGRTCACGTGECRRYSIQGQPVAVYRIIDNRPRLYSVPAERTPRRSLRPAGGWIPELGRASSLAGAWPVPPAAPDHFRAHLALPIWPTALRAYAGR